MGAWLSAFWHDRAMFERVVKGVMFTVGSAAMAGAFGPLPEGWGGMIIPMALQFFGIAMPAGGKASA